MAMDCGNASRELGESLARVCQLNDARKPNLPGPMEPGEKECGERAMRA